MVSFSPNEEIFWNAEDTRGEMTRIFDVCNGCRLCDKLCPSFTDLFDRIDAIDDEQEKAGKGHDNPALALRDPEFDHVTDECYQCKICYVKCPYTPPHEYQLDFPRLLLRWQAIRTKQKPKKLLRDFILGNTGFVGAIGSRLPWLLNWANTSAPVRWMMEKTTGIHRDKKLPEYHSETFVDWWRKREMRNPAPQAKTPTAGKAALFYTCTANFNEPEIGKKCVSVLEHNDVSVVVPKQVCCGMPQMGTGDYDAVRRAVDSNVATLAPLVEQGYTIVTPGPSCGYMIRQEYAHLATDTEKAQTLARGTMDICEYLMTLGDKKLLKTDFQPVHEKITYHLPCHLRAQNIGVKSRDLLKKIPGVEIETVQQCSGHDGSWSMTKEHYKLSLEVGGKLAARIEREKPATVASDCLLAHLHINELTHEQPKHPIEIIHRAYGLEETF